MGLERREVTTLADAGALITQLETAVEHRTVIGRAQGILMERYGIGDDAAFAILRRASNALNIKLHAVAASLVETRQLPREVRGPGG